MADFTPYLSCTRASTGYAQTVAGTLTSFASNVLRITDKGLLVEEARTNICRQSQTIGAWTLANVSVTADAVAAPDGTTTADTVTDNSASDRHEVYMDAVVGGADWAVSAYLKAGTHTWVQLVNAGSSGDLYGNFDLVTGSLGAKHASATTKIEALANGWYRCSVMAAHGTYYYGHVVMLASDYPGARPTYSGSGTTIHVWGYQIESGAYPSSYIPTTSAAVTRAQDVVQLIGAADTIAEAPAVSAVVSLDLIPDANCRVLRGGSPNMDFISANAHNQINNWSPTPGTLASGVLPDNSTNAAKYGVAVTKAGGRSITGYGVSVASDSGNNEFLELYLGSIPGAGFAVNTYIRRLSLWNTRISDADLQSRTA